MKSAFKNYGEGIMLIKDFEYFISDKFTKEKLEMVKGKNEYGFTNLGKEEILLVTVLT